MNKEEIVCMAREAGFDEFNGLRDDDTTSVYYEAWPEQLERFAALVAKHTLANIDPSSFMSWQEGYEVGAAREREECAKTVESIPLFAVGDMRQFEKAILEDAAAQIRKRGATNDTRTV